MRKRSSITQSSIRIADKVNAVLAGISGIILFLYMFLVSGNIIGRYLFKTPINGTLETGQMVLACVIFFGIAYTQASDSHIRVTVIINSLPPRIQRFIEIYIYAAGTAMMALMAYKALPFAIDSYQMNETNLSVNVPIWPTKFIFFIGWTLMGIRFFLELLKKIFNDNNLREER